MEGVEVELVGDEAQQALGFQHPMDAGGHARPPLPPPGRCCCCWCRCRCRCRCRCLRCLERAMLYPARPGARASILTSSATDTACRLALQSGASWRPPPWACSSRSRRCSRA
jgi:hypothetical protein